MSVLFPPVLQVGQILKEKFDNAHEVQQKKRRGRRMLLPRFQVRKKNNKLAKRCISSSSLSLSEVQAAHGHRPRLPEELARLLRAGHLEGLPRHARQGVPAGECEIQGGPTGSVLQQRAAFLGQAVLLLACNACL